MPCALPKNPIIICASSLSVKLTKSKLFMTLLMVIRLKFDEIKDTHIISEFWKTFYFHCASYYFPNRISLSYRFRIRVMNIFRRHYYPSHSFIFSDSYFSQLAEGV